MYFKAKLDAKIYIKERKENDTDWNSFTKKLLFKCPEGSVLEYPEFEDEQVQVNNKVLFVLNILKKC